MNTSPLPPTKKSIGLAKLATIFAVVGVLAFGLCTTGAIMSGGGNRGINIVTYLTVAAAIIEAVCLLGLISIGIIAIVRSIRREE